MFGSFDEELDQQPVKETSNASNEEHNNFQGGNASGKMNLSSQIIMKAFSNAESKIKKNRKGNSPQVSWEPINDCSTKGITKIPSMASPSSFGASFPPKNSTCVSIQNSLGDYSKVHSGSINPTNNNNRNHQQPVNTLNVSNILSLQNFNPSNTKLNTSPLNIELPVSVFNASSEDQNLNSEFQTFQTLQSKRSNHSSQRPISEDAVSELQASASAKDTTANSAIYYANDAARNSASAISQNNNCEKFKKIFGGHIEKTDYDFPMARWKNADGLSQVKNSEDSSNQLKSSNASKNQRISKNKQNKFEDQPQKTCHLRVRHYNQAEIRKYIRHQTAKRKEKILEEQKEKEKKKRQKMNDKNLKQSKGIQTLNQAPSNGIVDADRDNFLMSHFISKDTLIEKPMSTPENIGCLVAQTLDRCEKEVQVARSSSCSSKASMCLSNKSMDLCEPMQEQPHLSYKEKFLKLDPLVQRLTKAIQDESSLQSGTSDVKTSSYILNNHPRDSKIENQHDDLPLEELKARLTAAINDNNRLQKSLQQNSRRQQASENNLDSLKSTSKNNISYSIASKFAEQDQNYHIHHFPRLEVPSLLEFHPVSHNRQKYYPIVQFRKYGVADEKAALKIQAFFRGYKVRKVTTYLLKFKSTSKFRRDISKSTNFPPKIKGTQKNANKECVEQIISKTVPDYIKPFALLSSNGDVSAFVDSFQPPLNDLDFITNSSSKTYRDPSVSNQTEGINGGKNTDLILSHFNVSNISKIEKRDKETSMGSLIEGPLCMLDSSFKKDQDTQTSLEFNCVPYQHGSKGMNQVPNNSKTPELVSYSILKSSNNNLISAQEPRMQALITNSTSKDLNTLHATEQSEKEVPNLKKERFTDLINFKKKKLKQNVCNIKENQNPRDLDQESTEDEEPMNKVETINSTNIATASKIEESNDKKTDKLNLLNFKKKGQRSKFQSQSINKTKNEFVPHTGATVDPTHKYPNFSPANLRSRISAELLSHDVMGNALNHLKELENLQQFTVVQESQDFFERALHQSNLKNQEISNDIKKLQRDFSKNESNKCELKTFIEEAQHKISQLETEYQKKTELNINQAAEKLYQTIMQSNTVLTKENAVHSNKDIPTTLVRKEASSDVYSSQFTNDETTSSSSEKSAYSEVFVNNSPAVSVSINPNYAPSPNEMNNQMEKDSTNLSSSIPDVCPHTSNKSSPISEEVKFQMSESDNESNIKTDLSYSANLYSHKMENESSFLSEPNIGHKESRRFHGNEPEFIHLKSHNVDNLVLNKELVGSQEDLKEISECEIQSPEMTGYSESFEPDSSLSDSKDSFRSVRSLKDCGAQNNSDSPDQEQGWAELPISNKLMTHLHVQKALLPALEGHPFPLTHQTKQTKGALRSTLALMESIQKEEEVRFSQEKALLKLQEQSLEDEAKRKIAVIKSEGGPNIRKKLRGVELQLREQLSHISRLIETQNLAAQQKKLIYMHHYYLLSSTINPSSSMSPMKLLTSRVTSPIANRVQDSFSSSDAAENFSLTNSISLRDSPKATEDCSVEENLYSKVISQDDKESKLLYTDSKQTSYKEREALVKKDNTDRKGYEIKSKANEDLSYSADSITEESIAVSSHESQGSAIEEVAIESINDSTKVSGSLTQTSIMPESFPVSNSASQSITKISSYTPPNSEKDGTTSVKKSLDVNSTGSENKLKGSLNEAFNSKYESTFEKSSSDSELTSKRVSKSEMSQGSKRKGSACIPFALRIPLSPRSICHPRRYSSESDDSFTHSQNETASDVSDSEGKLVALRDELETRKAIVSMLKKERRKIKKERIASQEQALIKQIAAYDAYIQEAKQELEKEKQAQEFHDIVAVKPLIKKPQGNKKLSRPEMVSDKDGIFDESSLLGASADHLVESVEYEKGDSDASSLFSADSKKDDDSLEHQSLDGSSFCLPSTKLQEENTSYKPENVLTEKNEVCISTPSISEEYPTDTLSSVTKDGKHPEEIEESEASQESSTETIVTSPKKMIAAFVSNQPNSNNNRTKMQVADLLPNTSEFIKDSSPLTIENESKQEILAENTESIVKGDIFDPKSMAEYLTEDILSRTIKESVEYAIGIYLNKENKAEVTANANSTAMKCDGEYEICLEELALKKSRDSKHPDGLLEPKPEDQFLYTKDSTTEAVSLESEISSASTEKCNTERPKSPTSSVELMSHATRELHLMEPSSFIEDDQNLDKELDNEDFALNPEELVSRLLSVQASSGNSFQDEEEEEECQANKEFAVEGYEGSWLENDFWGSGNTFNTEEEAEIARLEEIKKFQEKHQLVLREVPNKPPPPYTPPPPMDSPLQVSQESIPVAKVVATSEVSTISLPHPQTAANTIRVPHDLSRADLRKLFSEITNIIPTKEEDILSCVQSHIDVFYEHCEDGGSPEAVQKPSDMAPCAPSNFDEEQVYEASCSKIFNSLLFDLTKEFASDVYSRSFSDKSMWNTSAFASVVRAGKKMKPHSKDAFSSLIQKKIKICMNWEPPLMRESSLIKWAKKRTDTVDQVLFDELQFEESNWTDFGHDEVAIKNQLAQEIFSSLIDNSVNTFKNILINKSRR